MRTYSENITLTVNKRGVLVLDTIMGCASGVKDSKYGCYNDCYSARRANMYGYDFSVNILRKFKNENHRNSIIKKINKSSFPFLRIGNSGDPSENWGHTISIIKELDGINKPVVIITKHWNKLTLEHMLELKKRNITINTSISAIDSELHERIEQYEILKNYCNSILRCVTFDFNKSNDIGLRYSILQDWILNTHDILETIFRASKQNKLIVDGIINTKDSVFLGSKCTVSKRNKKTYFGNCINCIEKCGVNL